MSLPTTEQVRSAFISLYSLQWGNYVDIGADFDTWLAKRDAEIEHRITATPPPGWFHFGSHIGQPDVKLIFWGEDVSNDGLPVWERPAPKSARDESDGKN